MMSGNKYNFFRFYCIDCFVQLTYNMKFNYRIGIVKIIILNIKIIYYKKKNQKGVLLM